MKQKINKIRAAFEQIDLAIELLSQNRSPIAIHTLAAAAKELTEDLCSHHKVPSWNDNWKIYIKDEFHKMWFKKINAPANFFKHADKDPLDVIEFNEEINESTILEAVMNIQSLGNEKSPTQAAFIIWIVMRRPQFFTDDVWSTFPNPEIARRTANWLDDAPRGAPLKLLHAFVLKSQNRETEFQECIISIHEEYGLSL